MHNLQFSFIVESLIVFWKATTFSKPSLLKCITDGTFYNVDFVQSFALNMLKTRLYQGTYSQQVQKQTLLVLTAYIMRASLKYACVLLIPEFMVIGTIMQLL